MTRRPSLHPTTTAIVAVVAAAAALHVVHRDAIAVIVAVVVSIPHSCLLAASRCPLPSPVGYRPHVAVHAVVTLLMALRPAGHGQSRTLALVPSCLDVGPSATTARVLPRRGRTEPTYHAPFLSFSLYFLSLSSRGHGEPESEHLSSIPHARVSTFISSCRPPPSRLDYIQAKLQFWSFAPAAAPLRSSPPHRGQLQPRHLTSN